MNFKVTKLENDKYIWLQDVALGQELYAVYRCSDKKILILDPDKKDYTGKDYKDKVKLEEKEFGIVQKIDSQAIMELAEVMKVMRTLGE